VQLSNCVTNVNDKKYKAGFKRLIPDKVLKPFDSARFGMCIFFEAIVF